MNFGLQRSEWDKHDALTSPSLWQKHKEWLAHITVVTGTLVWGFADLLVF